MNEIKNFSVEWLGRDGKSFMTAQTEIISDAWHLATTVLPLAWTVRMYDNATGEVYYCAQQGVVVVNAFSIPRELEIGIDDEDC